MSKYKMILTVVVLTGAFTQTVHAYRDLIQEEINNTKSMECGLKWESEVLSTGTDDGKPCTPSWNERYCWADHRPAIAVGILSPNAASLVNRDVLKIKYFAIDEYESAKAYLLSLVNSGKCK